VVVATGRVVDGGRGDVARSADHRRLSQSAVVV
jgi:hypothetical protein